MGPAEGRVISRTSITAGARQLWHFTVRLPRSRAGSPARPVFVPHTGLAGEQLARADHEHRVAREAEVVEDHPDRAPTCHLTSRSGLRSLTLTHERLAQARGVYGSR